MTPFRYLPKVLRTLLIINTLVFAIAAILGGVLGLQLNLTGEGLKPLQVCIAEIAAFDPNEPFQVWRYVTYMFIHFDFMHFFFNMLMLWMFGAEIAQWMGTKHFAALYFFCGIFAAVFSMVMSVLGLTNSPIIGASGALMGVFVAYYKFFPERRILMFFIIPMKIKYAMWLMVAFDLVFANTGDAIAHFAHLGGVVAGFIYMAVYMNVFAKGDSLLYDSPFSEIFRLFSKNPENYRSHLDGQEKEGKSASSNATSGNGSKTGESDVLEGEVCYMDEQKRMDEILKKVAREGINSLTDSEKQFLLQTGDKIRRRRGGM